MVGGSKVEERRKEGLGDGGRGWGRGGEGGGRRRDGPTDKREGLRGD